MTQFHEGQDVEVDHAWQNCPSTHCERSQECRSPHECNGWRKAKIVRFWGLRELEPRLNRWRVQFPDGERAVFDEVHIRAPDDFINKAQSSEQFAKQIVALVKDAVSDETKKLLASLAIAEADAKKGREAFTDLGNKFIRLHADRDQLLAAAISVVAIVDRDTEPLAALKAAIAAAEEPEPKEPK